jgi:hypothetical protein
MKTLIALQVAVFAFLSIPAGAAPPLPRGTEIQVNTDTTRSHFNPSVAVFPDGGFVVVWNATGARARFLDSQGRPTSGELALPVSGIVDQVVADRDGSFLVVWTGRPASSPASNVYVRRFNRNGTTRGKALRVNTFSTFNRSGAVAAIGPNGRFAVAWQAEIPCCVPGAGAAYTNAVARIFTARGNPATPEITLFSGSPAGPAGDDGEDAFPTSLTLAPDGTLSAIIRQSQCVRNILVRVPPNVGSPSEQALGPIFCSQAVSSRGSLAMGVDGSLITTWRDFDIQAQRFAPNGTPRGEGFRVSEQPVDLQIDPAVAQQAGGSFVVVWTEKDGRDGEGSGIFGRAFAPHGIPVSQDFQVNVTTAGDQYAPAIAAARQGSALVVWSQTLAADGRSDIFARVLSVNP